MKSIFKKTLVFGIISTVLTLSMSVTASAQCPITSIFGGNNAITSLFGTNSNNGTGCTSGNANNILNIFKNRISGNNKTCTTGNCNSNNLSCKTGNCNNNTTCTTGNCNNNGTTCTTGNCNNNDTTCTTDNCNSSGTCTTGNCDDSANTYESYANEVLKYVNEARIQNGLTALSLDSKLNEAANIRAKEIATKFSHTRPDGTNCFTVLKQLNITYRSSGENIAYGYSSAKAVVDGWLASPGHRANIMSTNFKYMGIGKNGTNWTQLFIG